MWKPTKTVLNVFISILLPALAFSQNQTAAREVLKRVSEAYRHVKTFQAKGKMVVEGFPAPTGSVLLGHYRLEIPIVISVVTPKKMRIESKDPRINLRMAWNGRKTWLYWPQLNQYTELASQPTWNPPSTASPLPARPWNPMQLAVSDLAEAARLLEFKNIAQNAEGARILREERIRFDGQDAECFVVQVTYKPSSGDVTGEPFSEWVEIKSFSKIFWIEKNRFTVLRETANMKRRLISSTSLAERQQSTALNEIKSNVVLPDALFEFSPPQGAKEVPLPQVFPNAASSTEPH